jgi:hypothetical protein
MKNALLIFLGCCGFSSFGQFADDAIMLPKKGLFLHLSYAESRFDSYWEKDILYKNNDIGKITKRTGNAHISIGLSNRINIFASLPYARNTSEIPFLKKQEGFQDISGGLKLSVLNPTNPFSVILSGAVSKPLNSYQLENQILALGLGSRTINGKLLLRYKLENGLYFGAQGGYLGREIVTLENDVYQNNQELVYSNKVAPPDGYDYGLKLGYLNNTLQIEAFGEKFTSLSGDNIQYNQLPFISNKVNFTRAGIYTKYQINKIGFTVKASQVISGLNTPKALNLSAGLFFQLSNGRNNDRFEY